MAGKRGGARAGAGRPPKPPEKLAVDGEKEPLDFLLAVMNDAEAAPALRVRAAITAAQYTHTKRSDGGKKEATQRDAERAAQGKFSPSGAPKLVVNNK